MEIFACAFEGKLPRGVRVTTKYSLGTVPQDEVYPRLRRSLESSLKDMRLERVDIMLLHSEIRPDDFHYPAGQPPRDERSTALSLYRSAVRSAFARLVEDGLIGHWGITGINHAAATIDAMSSGPLPVAVQAIANLLDSPGEMNGTGLAPRPRDVIAAAKAAGVGVMGVRAVQAGALTSGLDRADNSPTSADFRRAAPFRQLCAQWGEDPAIIAHRYALGIDGVDTLVLGVKKAMTIRPNGRSADYIAPGASNGCALACVYCYVPRRKGFANPITTFVNIDQICAAIERHALKLGPRMTPA